MKPQCFIIASIYTGGGGAKTPNIKKWRGKEKGQECVLSCPRPQEAISCPLFHFFPLSDDLIVISYQKYVYVLDS